MKPTLDLSNPSDLSQILQLNPQNNGTVYAFDMPQAGAASPDSHAGQSFQSPTDSYVNAFDPNNKSQFSPSNDSHPSVTPNLTKVTSDYGFRAGSTLSEPLIPLGGQAVATLPRPSNTVAWVVWGGVAYFAFKYFFIHSKG